MQEFLLNNWQTIFGVIFGGSGVLAWYRSREKDNIDAFANMQKAYDKYTEDGNARYNELQHELEVVRAELQEVHQLLLKERAKNRLCVKCNENL